jgi:hypothetical protein
MKREPLERRIHRATVSGNGSSGNGAESTADIRTTSAGRSRRIVEIRTSPLSSGSTANQRDPIRRTLNRRRHAKRHLPHVGRGRGKTEDRVSRSEIASVSAVSCRSIAAFAASP